KFAGQSGITSLMEDLGNALAGDSDMIMMGGGNPAHIPEVQARFKARLQDIVDSEQDFQRLIGIYDPPQGEAGLISALRDLLNREYGWQLTNDHIALTNGSQAAFFMLFNLFAGDCEDGLERQIVLPLAPEYIGYSDAGLTKDFFRATRPAIEMLDAHTFKYHVDFGALEINERTGALCVSRPTNPTGNVLTDAEMARLDVLARERDIPLIVDGAYGTPFPKLIFTEARPFWNDNTILCLSLSKFGLPAARTGIVIARPEIVRALSGVNAILNLATGSFGSMLASDLVRSGEIIKLSEEVVRPYYWQKAQRAEQYFREQLSGLPYALHKVEGAMFFWLWLKDCPVNSQTLYERLKARGVLVVPGHHFFPGLNSEADQQWQHRHECLRITYSQDEAKVKQGLAIIADEVKRAFS
ncbi:MAG: valine--pyruvate transaminase, partial [Oleiphilaceae bacterium]|nr:valine--pyruvate transaminase [Oleiphilaceae bacterium]